MRRCQMAVNDLRTPYRPSEVSCRSPRRRVSSPGLFSVQARASEGHDVRRNGTLSLLGDTAAMLEENWRYITAFSILTPQQSMHLAGLIPSRQRQRCRSCLDPVKQIRGIYSSRTYEVAWQAGPTIRHLLAMARYTRSS